MADDIIQRLGFDAGNAIATINQLKTALDSLNTSLTAVGTSTRNFNSSGNAAMKLYNSLNKSVQGLTQAISKMQSAQQGMGPIGSDPADIQNQLSAINQLTQGWGAFSASVPSTVRQAFAKAKADLVSFAAQNKITANQMTQAFAGGAQGSSAAIQGLNQRVQALQATHSQAASSIVQGNKKVQVSFNLLQGISFAILMQSLQALTRAIWDGTKAAADFNQTLAKTVAIEPSLRGNLGAIRGELISMANVYGRDLGDVSEAYYQTLQNQVGDATDSLYAMRAAADLSAANVVKLAESEELLTAVLKGWNIETSQAKRLSDVLFEAIKVGRFSAADLSDIIGRVGPLAHQMGVSFEESAAAIATMTVQGVRADTAVTQLRAVLNQLLKPTNELREAMQKEWGVDNAQQAIAKFGGLLPLLRATEKLAGNNADKMAEFFKNIRALNGAIGLTGPNAELAAANLNKLLNVQEGTARSAANLVLEHSKLQVETNRLNLAWTRLGESIRPAAENFVRGLATIANGFAMLLEKGRNTQEGLFNALNQNSQIALKVEEKLRETNARIAENSKRKYDEMQTQAVNYITELQKIHQKEVEIVKSSNKALVSTTKTSLDSVIDAQKRFVDGIAKATDATDKLKTTAQKQADLRMTLEDKVFQYQLDRWGTTNRVYQELAKSRELLDQALSKARQARSEEDLKISEKLLERAGNYAQAAASSAQMHGQASSAVRQAKELDLKITQGLIELEGQRTKVLQNSTNVAKAALPVEQKRLQLMEQLRDKILEGLRKFDKNTGEMKSTEQMQQGYKDAQMAFDQFVQNVQANKDRLSIAESLDLVKMGQNLESLGQSLPGLGLKVIFPTADSEFNRLKTTWEAIPIKLRVDFNLKEGVDPLSQLSQKILASTTRLKELEGQIREAQVKLVGFDQSGLSLIESLNKQGAAILGDMDKLSLLAQSYTQTGKEVISLVQQYNSIIAKTKELKQLDPSSPAFHSAFQQMKLELDNWVRSAASSSESVQGKLSNLVSPETVGQTLSEFNRITKGWEGIQNLPGIKMEDKIEYQNLMQALPSLEGQLKLMQQNIQNSQEPAANFKNSMEGSVQPTTLTAQNMNQINSVLPSIASSATSAATAFSQMAQAASAAAQAAQSAMSSGAGSFSRGGMQFLAGGGTASRWTDNVPAMLTPGEFVVNAKSTRKFFSQLQAMNAGQLPTYKEAGGPVTTIGDINVSVNQGETSRQTARDIANSLRRELRRGTATLN